MSLERQVYELAAQMVALRSEVNAQKAPQLAYSSIEDGAITEYDATDTPVAQYGQQFDGGHLAMPFTGPTPPQPTPAYVTPAPGALIIGWDGEWVDGAIVPTDFSRLEIHVCDTVDDAADTAVTLYATIETPRGGEVTVSLAPGVERFVRLVARSIPGKKGIPSVATPGMPGSIVDSAELDAINLTLSGLPGEIEAAKQEAMDASIPKVAGSVDALYIAASAVTEAKVAADAITTTKISDNAISSPKIIAGAVVAGKLTTGSVIAGNIAANAVTATTIAGLSIQTSHLAIGDMSNLIPNGAGELGLANVGWLGAAGLTYETTDKPTELRGVWKAASTTGTTTPTLTDWMNVEPGEQLWFEFWAKADIAGSKMYVEMRDQAGVLLPVGTWTAVSGENSSISAGSGAYPVGALTIPTAWTKYVVQGTIPATGVQRIRPGLVYFNHSAGTQGAVQSIAVRLRRRNAGKLIVDGAIVASKLAADSVTATAILGSTITAGKLAANAVIAGNIAANAVTSGTIAAGAITTDKLDANAINGIVITGSTLRTDDAGPRIVMRPGASSIGFGDGVFEIFSGNASESQPAEIYTIADGPNPTDNISLYIQGPEKTGYGGQRPFIQMFARDADSVSQAQLQAQAAIVTGTNEAYLQARLSPSDPTTAVILDRGDGSISFWSEDALMGYVTPTGTNFEGDLQVESRSLPRGFCGQATLIGTTGTLSTNSASPTTVLTHSFDVVAGRRYRMEIFVQPQSTVDGDRITMRVLKGGSVIQTTAVYTHTQSDSRFWSFSWVATATETASFDFVAFRSAGTGNCVFVAAGTQTSHFASYDVGL